MKEYAEAQLNSRLKMYTFLNLLYKKYPVEVQT